jgi:hypothetical protein
MIDQSNDKEIYSTKEKVHYQSKAVDIYSTGMHFNTKAKAIILLTVCLTLKISISSALSTKEPFVTSALPV